MGLLGARGWRGRTASAHFTRSVARHEGRVLDQMKNIPLPPRRQPPTKKKRESEQEEKGKAEAEKVVKERTEAEKVEKERTEAEKVEKERTEAEKVEKEKADVPNLTVCTIVESYISASRQLRSMSVNSLLQAVGSHTLDIQEETDVVEMLLVWLEGQNNTEAASLDFIRLLKLIRWNRVSEGYIRSHLLNHPRISTDAATCEFLNEKVNHINGVAPYVDLLTGPRSTAGNNGCLVVIGVATEFSCSPTVLQVNLDRGESFITGRLETRMRKGTAACVSPSANTLYLTGTGTDFNEIWSYASGTTWKRLAKLKEGRRFHGALSLGQSLYVVSGSSGTDGVSLKTVEKFNLHNNTASIVGQVIYGVKGAASVCHDDRLFVIGGSDEADEGTTHVQLYDVTSDQCTLLANHIPRSIHSARAVLWESQVIIVSEDCGFLLNLADETWSERIEIAAGRSEFGLCLKNRELVIFGGAYKVMNPDTFYEDIVLTDGLASVNMEDVFRGDPVVWNRLPVTLPRATKVYSFGALEVPAENQD